MSDLLSAASLFLAVIGLLYTAWYTEIRVVLDTTIPTHVPDRRPLSLLVHSAYLTRALPLLIGALAVSLALLPDVSRTVWRSLQAYRHFGVQAIESYDAVQTLFCAIWMTTVFFALHSHFLCRDLRKKLAKLKQP